MQIKQLIPQEYCLRCEVCCRFADNPTVWAPRFTKEEVLGAIEKNMIPPELFSHPTTTLQQHKNACSINLVEYEQGFCCPCFAPADKKCSIYSSRPFECQLYPFLLLKKNGQLFLATDIQCPYLKNGDSKQINAYKEYLRDELQKEKSISFLKQHRDLFCDYDSHDLDIICPITLE